MIITRISDGFGNQLFMYACGYATAQRLQTKLALDISYLATNKLRSYELDKLNIISDKIITIKEHHPYIIKVLSRKLKHAYIKMKYSFFYDSDVYTYNKKALELNDNTYLSGYWQTEKYFINYRHDLLNMFTPKYEMPIVCKNYIEKIKNCNSVAVHIRRGDYEKIGICLDQQYYDEAFNKVEQSVQSPKYFIFSDDIEYAKQLFLNKVGSIEYITYQSTNSTLNDFFMMKECKHTIIANSSYSWWAAWLNKNKSKIVVCPISKKNINDRYPDNWIKIEI